MIRKCKGGYKVVSESGKNLGGPYPSKAGASNRLRQVEYFKSQPRKSRVEAEARRLGR